MQEVKVIEDSRLGRKGSKSSDNSMINRKFTEIMWSNSNIHVYTDNGRTRKWTRQKIQGKGNIHKTADRNDYKIPKKIKYKILKTVTTVDQLYAWQRNKNIKTEEKKIRKEQIWKYCGSHKYPWEKESKIKDWPVTARVFHGRTLPTKSYRSSE